MDAVDKKSVADHQSFRPRWKGERIEIHWVGLAPINDFESWCDLIEVQATSMLQSDKDGYHA